MPSWTDFVQYFDKTTGGGGSTVAHTLDSKESKEQLAKVDDLLDESLRLLSGIQGDLNTRQYKIYRSKHNQLLLMVVDVKSEIREREENAIFFLNTAEKEQLKSKIQKLYTQCKAYHTDIVTASRRVQEMNSQIEINETGAPVGPADDHQSISSSITSTPSASFSDSAIASSISDSQSMSRTLRSQTSSGDPILAMLTRKVPSTGHKNSESSNKSGSCTMTLMYSCDDRGAVFSTTYRPANNADDARRQPDELLKFADTVMGCDLNDLEDFVSLESPEESWLSAIFSSLTLQAPNS